MILSGSKGPKQRNIESHLIFYSNIERDQPEELANCVQKELKYFDQFLTKTIDNIDVGKYGMRWAIDIVLTYSLTPIQVLEIVKPRTRLKLKRLNAQFTPRKVIMNENGEPIDYEKIDYIDSDVILTLKESTKLFENERLYYGREEVDWEILPPGFDRRIEYIVDDKGRKYKVKHVEEKELAYLVYLDEKCHIEGGTVLYINGVKVDYKRKIEKLNGRQLFDKRGEIHYDIIREWGGNFIIHPNRIIEGNLRDNTGLSYQYRFIENKFGEKTREEGVWIKVKESDDEDIHADMEHKVKLDIFFELIFASDEFVVWENENARSPDEKIKIKKIDNEEGRILLERLPRGDKIYPPKNTYQLSIQRDAIRTLMFRPSIWHRNLLKLFEPYDKVNWENPSENQKQIKWEFLTYPTDSTSEERDFVLKALNTPDFAILEGPPGSGKTTAICELIYHLLADNKKVLLCASTHVAVDNVLEKFEEKYRSSGGPMQNGIVPLRIGREECISQDIVKYQIEKRKEELKKLFMKEKWFSDANDEDKNRYLEDAVINCSNLVCGTTIGIIQYPRFRVKIHYEEGVRTVKYGNYVIPEFDYLIIDEASKTTFQEFLVPAIHAKKWILVGDIRQLSPYTDTLHVRVNLDGLFDHPARERAIVAIFKFVFERKSIRVDNNRFVNPPRFIYVDTREVISEIGKILPYKLEREKTHRKGMSLSNFLKYKFVIVHEKKIEVRHPNIETISEEQLKTKKAALFNADVIFVEENIYRRMYGSFPCTHILIRPNKKIHNLHPYRHLHWYITRGKGSYAYQSQGNKNLTTPWEIEEEVMKSLEMNWAGELAWRMKRVHELAFVKSGADGNSKKYYEASMYALMPPNELTDFHHILRYIRKIGQISLTSILTSIQEGIIRDWRDDKDKTVMSNGLPELVKEPRYKKLTYQHRMHPDISNLPRAVFYEGNALRDDESMEKLREWDYKRYSSRLIWINVRNAEVTKNTNTAEARTLLKELECFIDWAKNQKTRYTVIILTFYEAQRRHIRDMLRERFPENRRQETRFKINGIEVRNYTVDKAQGREGDIVFLSMVQNKRVGFMDSPNRLNVALTRAKYQIVIVGDRDYFRTQKHSDDLRKVADGVNEYMNTNEVQ